jgi:hypothetical protein
MKYVLVLLAGIVTGAFAAAGLFLVNPVTGADELSPLAVSANRQFVLQYSAVADDAIAHTNDGESRVKPQPADIQQLWEATVRNTGVTVTTLADAGGMPAGLGIKFASRSESTRLFHGEANVDSLWHVYLPGRGSFVLAQRENYFDYLRDIVIPASWSSGKNWKGEWRGNLTAGPGMLGTAEVAGGSGEFGGLDSEAVESLTARAYSTKSGPVAADGVLTIELPQRRATELASDQR